MKMQANQTHTILGCPFSSLRKNDVVQWADERLDGAEGGYIATVNVAILMMMRKSETLRNFTQDASLTVADGQPIIWLSKLLGIPLPERITGVDLCDDLTRLAALRGARLYLLGAKDDVLADLQTDLLSRYPDLKIAGVQNGYFSDDKDAADKIGQSRADILYVAMGVPKQERFIHEHWASLGVKVAIAVGGSFDVLSGHKKRAPRWMQITGLEWLYRLAQEPRRLFKRYMVTGSQFLWLGLKAALMQWRKP